MRVGNITFIHFMDSIIRDPNSSTWSLLIFFFLICVVFVFLTTQSYGCIACGGTIAAMAPGIVRCCECFLGRCKEMGQHLVLLCETNSFHKILSERAELSKAEQPK